MVENYSGVASLGYPGGTASTSWILSQQTEYQDPHCPQKCLEPLLGRGTFITCLLAFHNS